MLPAYPEDRRDDMNGKGENRKTSYAYKATPLRDVTDLQYSNRPSPYRRAWAPPQHGGAPFSDRQKSGFFPYMVYDVYGIWYMVYIIYSNKVLYIINLIFLIQLVLCQIHIEKFDYLVKYKF